MSGCTSSLRNRSAARSRISAKVIFCGLSMPHDSADRSEGEAAKFYGGLTELTCEPSILRFTIVNLKTAKALGLNVPLIFQQRADEVIE